MSDQANENYVEDCIFIDANGYRFRTNFYDDTGWILTKIPPDMPMMMTSIVSVIEQKLHMNIDEDFLDDDPIISSHIAAAESYVTALVGGDVATMTPIPGALRQAIKMLAAHFYENREAASFDGRASETPFGFLSLIAPYRAWGF